MPEENVKLIFDPAIGSSSFMTADLSISEKDALQLVRGLVGQTNIISFPRLIFDALGDIPTALLLGQLLFWTGRGANPEGWIYKTYSQLSEEICLSKRQLERSKEKLEELDLIETKVAKAGGSPTVHYRIKTDNLLKMLVSDKMSQTKVPKRAKRKSRNVTNESAKTALSYTDLTTDPIANPTTDDPDPDIESSSKESKQENKTQKYFPPMKGPAAEQLIEDVLQIEHPKKEAVRNLRNWHREAKKRLEEGRLEIPHGWEEFQRKKAAAAQREIAAEAAEVATDAKFHAAATQFASLHPEDQKRFEETAVLESGGILSRESPALRYAAIDLFMKNRS